MRFQLPWKRASRGRYGKLIPPAASAAAKDEEMNDFGDGSGSEEDGEGEEGEVGGTRRSVKPLIWMLLSVVATLSGRRMMRGGFGE